ncbi:MAG: hypothetical protein ACKVS6_11600 [Planctomycetota bacterium]
MKTIARIAAASALMLMIACASGPEFRVEELRGRRIVDIDRAVVATEYYPSRRVIIVSRDQEENGIGGFTFAFEMENAMENSNVSKTEPFEHQFELPDAPIRTSLAVSSGKSRGFFSKEAHGGVRLIERGDSIILSLDVAFLGGAVDERQTLPPNIFYEDKNRLRITGTFQTYKR